MSNLMTCFFPTSILPEFKKIKNIVAILSLTVIAIQTTAFGSVRADSKKKKAIIVHAMDPVRPGEITLLTGDWPISSSDPSLSGVEVEITYVNNNDGGFTNKDNVVPSQRILPEQISGQSLKFRIPKEWPEGIYACKVIPALSGETFEPSPVVVLNAPDPWWFQGDGGASKSSPGGWLRIFGKSLCYKNQAKVRLSSDQKTIVLTPKDSTKNGPYSLLVDIPESLAPGNYTLFVHSGLGGDGEWRKAGTLQIGMAEIWKEDVFNVRDFRSENEGNKIDWTEPVKAALAKAENNGGGVVFFPRGRYVINEELKIPPHVIIRGESQALVSLYWPPREKALPSLITGTDNFVVEDISLYTDGFHRNVISGANNFKVHHVLIRGNIYYRHSFVGVASTVKPVSRSYKEGMGAGIRITGNNAEVTDCDIYHSAAAIEMFHTCGGLIARNRMDYGWGPMMVYGLTKVIIEDNECSSASPWASGFGISLYYGASASYHVYFAHNHIRQNLGNDREAVTTDGHGTAYIGKITGINGTTISLEKEPWWGNNHKDLIPRNDFQSGIERRRSTASDIDPTAEWHGITMYILDGKGAGQYRNILACEGKNVTLEKPFVVMPDSTSIVSIGKYLGRMLFVGNKFHDVGPSVQLYAPNCECIVAENQAWRAESMNCGGDLRLMTFKSAQTNADVEALRVEPSWYNQFLDNHIWEGNGWGNKSCMLNIYGRTQAKKDQMVRIPELPISRAHIVRDNLLDNNASILIEGAVKDVVIQGNSVRNSDEGIVIKSRESQEINDPKSPSGIMEKENSVDNTKNQ